MFVDFDKTFKKKDNQDIKKIPDSLLQHLNKSLPEGLKYIPEKDGTCHITSDDGDIQISDLIFEPTKEQRKVLGEDFTFEDVLAYMYNAQQPIQMKNKKPGIVVLNGHDVAEDKFIQNPFKDMRLCNGSFYLEPKPFPNPFSWKVEGGECEKVLTVRRVPNQSVSVAKFESDPTEAFILRYLLDESENTMQLSISLNLKAAKSVSDLVDSVSIYNAFVDGTVKIAGAPILKPFSSTGMKRYDDDTLLFWQKVLKIEQLLNVSFKLPMEDINYHTICLVERIYQSLIYGQPTVERQRLNSISGVFTDETRVLFTEYIKRGKPAFFIFEIKDSIDLFGINLQLYGIRGICDAAVDDYKIENEKYTIYFKDVSPDKSMFASIIYFKDKNSMEDCRRNRKTLSSDLTNAKNPSEYL